MSSRGGNAAKRERSAMARAVTTPIGPEPPMVATLRGLIGKRVDLRLTVGDTRQGGNTPTVKVTKVYPITHSADSLTGASTNWWMDGKLTEGSEVGRGLSMRVSNITSATLAPPRGRAITAAQKQELGDRQRRTYERMTPAGRRAANDRLRVTQAEQRQRAEAKAAAKAAKATAASPKSPSTRAPAPTTHAKTLAKTLASAVSTADRAYTEAVNSHQPGVIASSGLYTALQRARNAYNDYLSGLTPAQRTRAEAAVAKLATPSTGAAPKRSRAKKTA